MVASPPMEALAIKGASKRPELQVVGVVPIREAVAPGLSTPVQSCVHIALMLAYASAHNRQG